MSYEQNPYYYPTECGLVKLDELDEDGLSYEYNTLVLWACAETGRLFYATDRGCSCPTPFEDYYFRGPNETTLTEITQGDSVASFIREVESFPATQDEREGMISKATAALKTLKDRMSTDNLTPPPIAQEAPPLSVSFSRDEANYFLHVVDFHRELIIGITKDVAPLDLPVVLAFLQSAIETQIHQSRQAFDEQRIFFNTIYPVVLHQNAEEHPEESTEGSIMIVVPTPRNGPALDTYSEPPRIITPSGTKMVQ